ncbi:hypothetical protein [Mesorhizobium sp. ANAO-SY3R2]|uniref:hypothetical protein n=1 Tax=Mesorhizobium sp. ANAO-SY3R2 TaxID=3166644 RepID=UPI0036707555
MTKWTSKLVRYEMAKAYQVLFDTTGGIGPDTIKSSWPDYRYSTADIAEQRIAKTNGKGRMRAKVPRTAREIYRMEIILAGATVNGLHRPAWATAYLNGDKALRRALVEWCMWELYGWDTEAECRRRGWAYSTFRSRRDKAAGIIADALNTAGVPTW